MINTTIGSYQIIRPLGAGGMAQVFEARNTMSGQRVALKLLASHTADPADVRRFRREAAVVQQLSHPNIITIYEIGDSQGRPYIALELLNNSLEAMLRSGPLAPDQAMKLLLPVLAGLEHAHQHGLVHRDIKPSNVLMRDDKTPVLSDFDLARPQRVDPRTRITVEGELLGTPAYMAPEQLRGTHLDGRTDLYACGAMLFEMLTGRTPFEGDLSQTITGHLQHRPPSLLTLVPNTSPALAELVERMLDKDPAKRPASAAIVHATLEALLSGAAAPVPAQAPPLASVTAQNARPAALAPSSGPALFTQIAIGVGILTTLLVCGMLAFGLSRSQSSQLPPTPAQAAIVTEFTSTQEASIEQANTPTQEPKPTTIPTHTPRPTVLPVTGALTEIGAPLLTDPQLVTGGNGATYVIGSVGIHEVSQTGVFILYGEVLANQEVNQRASIDVILRDAAGKQLATGTGLTQSPFIEPYSSSALLVVLIPEQPLPAEGTFTGQFTIKLLPAEAPVLALDVEPGVQAMVLEGSVPSYQLNGSVTNNQELALTSCKAIVLLYDEQFRVIAIENLPLQAPGEILASGTSLSFDKAVFSLGKPAAGYRVYAYGEVK